MVAVRKDPLPAVASLCQPMPGIASLPPTPVFFPAESSPPRRTQASSWFNQAHNKPKIRPENKGIKPKSNRHIRAVWETARRICPAKAGRRPQGRASGRERVQPKNSLGHCASWLPARTTLASPTILHSRPSFCILRQPLPANAKLCQPPPSPILFSHRVAIRNGGPDAVSHG